MTTEGGWHSAPGSLSRALALQSLGCPDTAPELRELVGVLGHGSKVTQGQAGVDPVGRCQARVPASVPASPLRVGKGGTCSHGPVPVPVPVLMLELSLRTLALELGPRHHGEGQTFS